MYKNPELETGKIIYSDLDIARMLKIDIRTLRKYESGLQEGEKPIMTLIPTKKRDPETGLMLEERVLDFTAFNNLLAIKFTEIDDQLNDKVSKEDYNKLLREFNEIKKLVLTKEVEPIQI